MLKTMMNETEMLVPLGVAGLVLIATVVLLFFLRKGGAKSEPVKFLNKQRQSVALIEKIELSHDTRLFRFALPTANTCLGLPSGKHVKLFGPNAKGVKEGEWNGRPDPEMSKTEIERKYTPVTGDETLGHFDLVIKVYKRGEKERFPDGGKFSQYLDSLQVGDKIDIQGPIGLYEYNGKGTFLMKRKERKFKNIGMMSGGTGITPMLRVISSALEDPNDDTKLWLLYANQTEGDILVRNRLETLQQQHPDRFKLHYTLDNPPTNWSYSSGFISEDMIKANMPPPGPDTVILMCGPPPMIKFACIPNLDKLHYPKDTQVDF